MPFQFCCPQGHVLQGELSQVGQLLQCPMCGSSFLVPPPSMDPVNGGPCNRRRIVPGTGNLAGPRGLWTIASPPGRYAWHAAAAEYADDSRHSAAGAQPFAAPTAPPPDAGQAPQQSPESSPSDAGRPKFDLGFDPSAKAALPFDLPGEGEPAIAQTPASPLPPPSFPAPSFPLQPLPAGSSPALTMPATFGPSTGNPDFFQSAPKVSAEPPWPDRSLHPRTSCSRCRKRRKRPRIGPRFCTFAVPRAIWSRPRVICWARTAAARPARRPSSAL